MYRICSVRCVNVLYVPSGLESMVYNDTYLACKSFRINDLQTVVITPLFCVTYGRYIALHIAHSPCVPRIRRVSAVKSLEKFFISFVFNGLRPSGKFSPAGKRQGFDWPNGRSASERV